VLRWIEGGNASRGAMAGILMKELPLSCALMHNKLHENLA
jgi:hypothetical protein